MKLLRSISTLLGSCARTKRRKSRLLRSVGLCRNDLYLQSSGSRVPTGYHGDRARFLQYEAGQILLRQQIAALIELWELPAELEVRLSRSITALSKQSYR